MEDDQLIPANGFCAHHHVEMNFIYTLREYGLIEVVSNEGNDYTVRLMNLCCAQ